MTASDDLSYVREVLAHSEWADSVFFDAWGKSPCRDHEEMRRRASHMRDVRHAFRSMLSGGPPIYPAAGEPPSHDQLRQLTADSHAELRAFVDTVPAGAGSKMIHIPFFPDPPCVISILEGLTQVALHTQHHRGQCMTRLGEMGGRPENVDWIIWLWQKKPAPRWPG